MAMHLLTRDDPPDMVGAERHLSSSFTLDDQNFEARHMLAQLFFAKGEAPKSEAMFQEIARRAPPNFRKFAPKHDNLITARLAESVAPAQAEQDQSDSPIAGFLGDGYSAFLAAGTQK